MGTVCTWSASIEPILNDEQKQLRMRHSTFTSGWRINSLCTSKKDGTNPQSWTIDSENDLGRMMYSVTYSQLLKHAHRIQLFCNKSSSVADAIYKTHSTGRTVCPILMRVSGNNRSYLMRTALLRLTGWECRHLRRRWPPRRWQRSQNACSEVCSSLCWPRNPSNMKRLLVYGSGGFL